MPDPSSDAALGAALARGDRQALERIYRSHKDGLYTLAASIVGDRHTAEDVLHDVFVALARRAGRLTLTGSLRGYLATSCVNRARDVLRRRERLRREAARPDRPAPADEPSPDLAVEAADEAARLLAALAELPDEQRLVVAMHVHGGMKFREVAEMLEISINTVQSRYRYALAALRARLLAKGERR